MIGLAGIKITQNEIAFIVIAMFYGRNYLVSDHEMLKKEIVYNENDDITEIKEYRKGWCYQDRNDEFALTGIFKYSYVR